VGGIGKILRTQPEGNRDGEETGGEKAQKKKGWEDIRLTVGGVKHILR